MKSKILTCRGVKKLKKGRVSAFPSSGSSVASSRRQTYAEIRCAWMPMAKLQSTFMHSSCPIWAAIGLYLPSLLFPFTFLDSVFCWRGWQWLLHPSRCSTFNGNALWKIIFRKLSRSCCLWASPTEICSYAGTTQPRSWSGRCSRKTQL